MPEKLVFSATSFSSTPVMAISVRVNGMDALIASPESLYGRAEQEMPRLGGIATWDYLRGSSESRVLATAQWIKVLTNRAYQAVAEFDLSDLTSWSDNAVLLSVIFGPNGQMIVGSDPAPTSETDQPKRDVADACGLRLPSAHFDFKPDRLYMDCEICCPMVTRHSEIQ